MRGLTPDQIEIALREEEAVVARARARQLALLRIADVMQLPAADGARSMKEWIAGRLDVSPETASRLTTAASRLADSPELANQLSVGEITFDRAEATSRIPVSEQKAALRGLDIRGLRHLAARYRRLTAQQDHESHQGQHLVLQPNLDESRWDLWGVLDGYGGAVVNKVLTEEADSIPELPDGRPMGIGYRRAVALTNICENARPEGKSTPLITVFVDEIGASIEAGPPVGLGLVDKLACNASLEVIVNKDGQPLGVGRTTRVISNRLRRAILHRDGGCSADGCVSTYRLEPHHILPFSEGGPTDPDNLTTLCWFHHHVVIHGWGYRIDPRLGPGRIRFIKPGHAPP